MYRRLSETGEEWGALEPKRQRRDESETDVKLECDDAIDAYTFAAAPPPAHPDTAALPAALYVDHGLPQPDKRLTILINNRSTLFCYNSQSYPLHVCLPLLVA